MKGGVREEQLQSWMEFYPTRQDENSVGDLR
jgi:hypothetical protein